MACCDFHNRLDRKLSTAEYVGIACGSVKADNDAGANIHERHPDTGEFIVEGKPEFCCFECPVLHGTEAPLKPKTPLELEKEALLARLAQLEGV